jgi:hypothetical protein
MSNPITVLDVKNALRDEKFRSTLPENLKEPVQKFLGNQNCSCNLKIYQQVLAEAKEQITAYYPEKSYVNPDNKVEMEEVKAAQKEQLAQQAKRLATNVFKVINCSIGELEERMKALPPGRKQITMSRYEDQVTVLINELEFI